MLVMVVVVVVVVVVTMMILVDTELHMEQVRCKVQCTFYLSSQTTNQIRVNAPIQESISDMINNLIFTMWCFLVHIQFYTRD